MKSLVIFLVLIITNSLLLGQSNCTYEGYFLKVGEASYDAYSKNIESAQKKYKEAFLETTFALGQDLRKALKVSKQLKDTAWTEELSIKLAKGGIPKSYFNDLKDYSWYSKFQLEYTIYEEYYKSNFNLDMRQQVLELRTQDSTFNDNYHKWRKGKKQMTLSELTEGAKKVYCKLNDLYEKYGFPCEQKMGYYFNNGDIENYPILVLLIHTNQRGVIYLNEFMSDIVCEGKLRPEEKSSLIGMKGFGEANIGIEQEMKIRYEMYKAKE